MWFITNKHGVFCQVRQTTATITMRFYIKWLCFAFCQRNQHLTCPIKHALMTWEKTNSYGLCCIKGIVCPNMKILCSLLTLKSFQTGMTFFLLKVGKQTDLVTTDVHFMDKKKKKHWETSQNILFFFRQKTESLQVWDIMRVSKWRVFLGDLSL